MRVPPAPLFQNEVVASPSTSSLTPDAARTAVIAHCCAPSVTRAVSPWMVTVTWSAPQVRVITLAVAAAAAAGRAGGACAWLAAAGHSTPAITAAAASGRANGWWGMRGPRKRARAHCARTGGRRRSRFGQRATRRDRPSGPPPSSARVEGRALEAGEEVGGIAVDGDAPGFSQDLLREASAEDANGRHPGAGGCFRIVRRVADDEGSGGRNFEAVERSQEDVGVRLRAFGIVRSGFFLEQVGDPGDLFLGLEFFALCGGGEGDLFAVRLNAVEQLADEREAVDGREVFALKEARPVGFDPYPGGRSVGGRGRRA